MDRRFFFKKKMRLSNTDFMKLFKKSTKFENNQLIVLSCLNSLSFARLGIIVSKKVSKHAYKRNLIKRIIRESFRCVNYNLLYMDFIIIVKYIVSKLDKTRMHKIFQHVWMRYCK
ncbi:Ribonuclease P protein component [Buchnera aphidicola (Pterocallis alni)]|uniref:ribonuclease P protein component n=1 Tax=Buchnera aphidicola TaxID=9 RepID=UPI0034639E91